MLRRMSRSRRSRPASSTSSRSSASRATRASMEPAPRTSAKSRTRLSSRLATRGVPRERDAIASAPSSSTSTSRMPAERRTIWASSAGAYSSRRWVTPKRSRSGVVSRPVRVVAPISVNSGRSSVTTRGARALADGDRQLAVLHRRIEGLLERPRQAVDLVDEEDAARLERGQVAGHVALALERRAGGRHEADVELVGDDLRERRLAEPGRPGQQHVVERLAARPRRLDEDRELLLDALLADEVVEALGPQRAVEVVLGLGGDRVVDALDAGRADAAAHRRRLERLGDQLLGRLAGGRVEQPVGLLRAEAEAEQALARERARDRRRPCGARRSRRSPCRRPSRAARR